MRCRFEDDLATRPAERCFALEEDGVAEVHLGTVVQVEHVAGEIAADLRDAQRPVDVGDSAQELAVRDGAAAEPVDVAIDRAGERAVLDCDQSSVIDVLKLDEEVIVDHEASGRFDGQCATVEHAAGDSEFARAVPDFLRDNLAVVRDGLDDALPFQA